MGAMTQILVLLILIASTPTFGLLENLYQLDTSCHLECDKKFEDHLTNREACRTGCGYKLLADNCRENCEKLPVDQVAKESCKYGCDFSKITEVVDQEVIPELAIDPVPEVQPEVKETQPEKEERQPEVKEPQSEADESQSEEENIPSENSDQRPRSIILIRIRQYPVFMPPPESMVDSDPRQMFRDMIERFRQRMKLLQKEMESSANENSNDQSTFDDLRQRFVNPSHYEDGDNIQDSYDESRYLLRKAPVFRGNIFDEYSQQQSRMFLWSFICVVILMSLLLFYLIITLCGSTPKKDVPLKPKGIFLQTYDNYDYNNEKIQPEDDVFESTEPLPIKLKLSSI